MEYQEGDYNCDICGQQGSFYDGSICGVGEDSAEICLCLECLNKEKV